MGLIDATKLLKKKASEVLSNKNETTSTPKSTSQGDWIGSRANISVADTKKTSTDYGTYKDDLDRLTEAQKKYQVAQLKTARDKALANLASQEQEIKPTYQNARNMSSATSQQNARSFAEYMANRGLTNSGASAQAEINRQSALQNSLGNINTAEANAFRDIANQRTQVNNDYVNGVATANAAIQQQYLNNLLNYNEQQRQYVNSLKNQALGQYSGDYQAYMNTLDPNSLEYLQTAALRGSKVANNNANAYSYNNSMNKILSGNWSYNDLLATGMSNEQAQELYTKQQEQLQAQAQAQAEQQAWDRYIEQAKLDNATRLNNAQIANYNSQIYSRNKSADNSKSSPGKVANLSTHKDIIKNNFVTEDEFGDAIYNRNGIAQYLTQEMADEAIDRTDARSLAKNYGLNYYQLTPEYQQIWNDMGQTATMEEGLEIYKAYKKDNPDVDERIYDQILNDYVAAHK